MLPPTDPPDPLPPLAPAPRALPPTLTVQVLFGGIVGQIGWSFFLAGMLFVWIFDVGAAVQEWFAFRGDVEVAQGVLATFEPTNVSVNERPVFEAAYTFRLPDGRAVDGISFATAATLAPGSEVTVEFVDGDPVASRIAGMTTTPGGALPMFVLVFPIVGALIGGGSVGRRLRPLRLLRNGTLTTGTLETAEATNSRVNEQPVMRLTFRFQDEHGVEHTVAARTHEPWRLEDESRERLVLSLIHI